MTPKRAALYARVSTNKHKCRACRTTFREKAEGQSPACPKCGSHDIERSQTPETQLLPLRQYAQARGIHVVEYIDRESSGKRRPRLEAMLMDARRRLFDTVVVVRFDRFARSVKELVLALEEFQVLGINFVSLNESIDTTTAMGKFFFSVVAAFAEFERSIIRERVRQGIDRARSEGKALGRPRVEVDPLQIAGLRARGYSWNEIAAKLGVGRGTAERALKSLSQKPSLTPANVGHIS